jgi:hypothetical protein
MGNLLKVVVGAANIHDTIAGCGVFRSVLQKYPSLEGVCGDAGLGVRLLILFCLWVRGVIFQRKLFQKVGVFYLRDGVWSVRLVG